MARFETLKLNTARGCPEKIENIHLRLLQIRVEVDNELYKTN